MAEPLRIKPQEGHIFDNLRHDWYHDRITWRECSELVYTDALSVLPPERYTMSGFLMGEPYTHTGDDAVFAQFVSYRGRFFARYSESKKADDYAHALLLSLQEVQPCAA